MWDKAFAAYAFSQRPGPIIHCQRSILNSPPTAHFIFLQISICSDAIRNTLSTMEKNSDDDFNLDLNELESFIGLQVSRGVLAERNTPI